MRKPIRRRVQRNHRIEEQTLQANWERFRGQHVIVIGDEIVGAREGDEALRLLREMERRHPKCVPLITFVPQKDKVYIL